MNFKLPKLGTLLKHHFFTGMLIFIPIAATAWLLGILWSWVDGLKEILPNSWQPMNFLYHQPTLLHLFNFTFTIGMLALFVIGVSILGWSSRHYLGQKVLDFISHGIINRIPVIRSIYSALDQLLRTIAEGNSQQFSRVVYCEFPRKGIYSIAFVTGETRASTLPSGYVNIFIPMTPNPTSGNYLIVPEAELIDTQMSVEEAFKVILSLGLAQPERKTVSAEPNHVG